MKRAIKVILLSSVFALAACATKINEAGEEVHATRISSEAATLGILGTLAVLSFAPGFPG